MTPFVQAGRAAGLHPSTCAQDALSGVEGRRSERGAALVEFALVSLVLYLLLAGASNLVWFGLVWFCLVWCGVVVFRFFLFCSLSVSFVVLFDPRHAGVVRGGVEAGAWRVEGSWFHGREPDDDRTDLDLGPLDSGAVRVAWTRGEWSAQASAAFLEEPEAVTPFDAKKLTASLARTSASGRIAWMAAFGQKREIHGNLEAYLFEANIRATPSNIVYARAESVAKDILDAGFHPGAFHRHRQSQVGALTARLRP